MGESYRAEISALYLQKKTTGTTKDNLAAPDRVDNNRFVLLKGRDSL
jgi:hypothetical protein